MSFYRGMKIEKYSYTISSLPSSKQNRFSFPLLSPMFPSPILPSYLLPSSPLPDRKKRRHKKAYQKKSRTYNSRYSLVVTHTHSSTNPPVRFEAHVSMPERTGWPVLFNLWSYVKERDPNCGICHSGGKREAAFEFVRSEAVESVWCLKNLSLLVVMKLMVMVMMMV